MAVLQRDKLERSPLADLHAIASEIGIEGFRRLRKDDLIGAILDHPGGDGAEAGGDDGEAPRPRSRRRGRGSRARGGEAEAETASPGEAVAEAEAPARGRTRRRAGRGRPVDADPGEPVAEAAEEEPTGEEETRAGILDVLPNGSGFMRADPFAHGRDDVYISPAQIRRCELRTGDEIAGPVRPPRRSERHPSLVRVETVNGGAAEPPAERPRFRDLTPVFATERLPVPDGVDTVPFGKGSRVAVVDPPGADAAPLLRAIVKTLAEAQPDVAVTVVLAGARPEDETLWRRESGAQVSGGGFDVPGDDVAQSAEMALERARRAVEGGGDAVLVVDALEALPNGLARRLFGSARNVEDGGSLTVIATTGLSAEFARVATTRLVLEATTGAKGEDLPRVSAASDTLRADLLDGGAPAPAARRRSPRRRSS